MIIDALDTQIYGYNLFNDPEQRNYCIVCPHCFKNQMDSGLVQAIYCSFCSRLISNDEGISQTVPIKNNKCNCYYFTSKITSLFSSNAYSFINPTNIKSIVLSINKDSIVNNQAIYNEEFERIDYEHVMKTNIIPFFSSKSRIIEKGVTFNIGDIELKVIGSIPEIRGKVSMNTRIQCINYHSNNTVLLRALIITKVSNNNITTDKIKVDILTSPKEQLTISKGNGITIGRHEFYVRNCIPECGLISPDTLLSIEQKTVVNVTKIKLAVINNNRFPLVFSSQFTQRDYERYIIEDYYKPYFISGVSKYIERGDIIKIEDIEFFVLNCIPEVGYINSATLFWLKFNKTRDQCLEYITSVDNTLALGMMMNNENRSSSEIQLARRETSQLRLRILGEYFITREILQSVHNNSRIEEFQDVQIMTLEDTLGQQKLRKIAATLPSFEIHEKYIHSLKNNENEETKKCVICLEEYSLKQSATTLPCCKKR